MMAFFAGFIGLQAVSMAKKGASAAEGVATDEVSVSTQTTPTDYSLTKNDEDTALLGEPNDNDVVTVIVKVQGESLLEFATARGLTVADLLTQYEGVSQSTKLKAKRDAVTAKLGGVFLSKGFEYSTVFNGFSAEIYYGDLERVESCTGVEGVILSNTYEKPTEEITENLVDVYDTGIFKADSVEYNGTGTVVAVLDTGTDISHEVFDMELDETTLALTKDEVAAVASQLAATAMSANNENSPKDIDEDDLYINSKLPFGYDYADGDTNVYPTESHGTHVAGIITGKSDRITGVAPKAQLATFKVFPDNGGGAETEYLLSALNDAVLLGVDAINMSLGASCGFSREVDEYLVNEAYDAVEAAGICLVVAASNDATSSKGGAHGDTNLATNPDSGTVGSPASYSGSLAVASISGVKTPYLIANGEKIIYYSESRLTAKTDPNNFVKELLGNASEGTFEYVLVPGIGNSANYTGIDVTGKIAVIKRGSTNFEDKVKTAMNKGAIAAIIYNHLSGSITMSVGSKFSIPSCMVSMDFGQYFVEKGNGTITISKDYLAGPFMSDFTSWGVLPNLTLSPDITAHGGDITSSFPGGNEYGTISGTSMACPNLAGALILVRQYVKEMDATLTPTEQRDLAYSLMMSTAGIARNEEGNPYSPRRQGAGLGDIKRSVSTKAYLTVDGSNRPKLSLGDDPSRTGVYTLTFNVHNLSGEALSYKLNPIVMTESMSSDGKTVAEKAHMLDSANVYALEATKGSASINGATVSLGGYSSAEITVTVRLTDEGKSYLNEHFANGMYVEGYVELQSLNSDGINLNIPYLAFYGDWADAPMLDVSAYEVGESKVDSSVLEEDKLVADVFGTLPYGGFTTTDNEGKETEGSWGMGEFAYRLAPGYSEPAIRERYASITSNPDGMYQISAISAGLLRGAKRVEMQICDSVTGEVIWTKTSYNARKAHSSGGTPTGGFLKVEFDIRELGLANNSKYTFEMECFLDWEDGNQGNKNTFSFEFTVDDERPVLVETKVRESSDGKQKDIDLYIYDNHYIQGAIAYTYENKLGEDYFEGLTALADGVIPATDSVENGVTRITVPATAYWSILEKNGGKLYIETFDYARNSRSYEINIADAIAEVSKLEKTRDAREEYTIRINGQLDLDQYVRVYSPIRGVDLEGYWTNDYVWTSSAPDIVEVNQEGFVTGLKAGEAEITVSSKSRENVKCSFKIKVDGNQAPLDITVKGLELSEHLLELERGESRTITVDVKPYNFTGEVSLVWKSTSATVKVEVNPDDQFSATVTAIKTGVAARISVSVDGRNISDSCTVRVKEEFKVEDGFLQSYTGRGDENGVVEIPDDLGIYYIYPMAFLNNPYITKIIIPEGVMQIYRAGIYGCDNLEEVVLPESLETIDTFAFGWNPSLKKINLDHVKVIGSRAFIYCTALEEVDLSKTYYIKTMAFYGCSSLKTVDLSKVGAIGEYAFAGCTGLTELVIPKNTSTGTAAFINCTGLTNVVVHSTNLGIGAFANCTGLQSVTFTGDVRTIGAEAFYGCLELASVQFLGSVYEIESQVFGGCAALKEFTLPAGLTKLGAQAFIGCEGLETLRISRDAKVIEADVAAFHGMENLSAFEVEEGNKYLSSADGVLYDKTGYTLIAYPIAKKDASFTVPEGVRVIGASAFTNHTYLSEINLSNVEKIEKYAFYQAGKPSASTYQLTVTGYDNVREIGEAAFTLSGLQTIPVSQKTTYIGDIAFAACFYLTQTKLVLPDSVTFVGMGAFSDCPFKSITLGANLKEVGDLAFGGNTSLTSIDFGGLTSISSQMFYLCTSLRSIDIPESIKEIGAGAFQQAENLTSVTLPEGITAIPDSAFEQTKIASIVLPESVQVIGARAFANTPLNAIDLGNVKTVGDGAFENTKLTNVISDSVKEVGAGAFKGCEALETVELRNALKVGANAFANCGTLISVNANKATEVGDRAFAGCSVLETVNLSKVEKLGAGAFQGATSLEEISLPALKTLGANAFNGTAISTFTLANTVNSVAEQAFNGAQALKSIQMTAGNSRYVTENGVLYLKHEGDLYTLIAYPEGKTDSTYVANERTVKVGAYAFANNQNLTKVMLPAYLQVIGAGAFQNANSLAELHLEAAAAPRLESHATYDAEEEAMDNVYYNFSKPMGEDLTFTIYVPTNASGYDGYIWGSYAGDLVVQNENDVQPTLGALDFMDRVRALPNGIPEGYQEEVEALERMYRLFSADQKAIVQEYYEMLQDKKAGTSGNTSFEEVITEGNGRSYTWIVYVLLASLVAGSIPTLCLIVRKRRK